MSPVVGFALQRRHRMANSWSRDRYRVSDRGEAESEVNELFDLGGNVGVITGAYAACWLEDVEPVS